MEILKVDNLTKIYGKDSTKVVALDHVSFSVEKGEFVAIVGASGSGKSTLLHLIGGVDRPTSGKVFIDGKDIFNFNDDKLAIFRRRQVGLIYQFYNLIPILNVEENITLPLSLDNREVDKEKLNDLLKLLGLQNRKNHLPNELSGGQQQRTSIGRALITNPTIILADEPTGNLDSKSSDEIVALLKKSNKELNQTIIMITHNMEIAKVADRIIEMANQLIDETIKDDNLENEVNEEINYNNEKIATYQKKLAKLVDMYLNDMIDKDNYLVKKEEFELSIHNYEQKNKEINSQSIMPKELLKTKLQNLKQNIIDNLNYNANYVSEEVIDMFVKNIIVREDKFDWKLNYLNDLLEEDEDDNQLNNDNNIFLTRIVITKDDVDRFLEHHKEYKCLRLKESILVDIYL